MSFFSRLLGFKNKSDTTQPTLSTQGIRAVRARDSIPATEPKPSIAAPVLPRTEDLTTPSRSGKVFVKEVADEPYLHLKTLEKLAELPLPFDSINKAISVGPHLIYKICPVLLGGTEGSGASVATIFCLEQYLGSSELQSVIDLMHAHKNKKWDVWTKYKAIVLPEQIFVPLVRGSINRDTLKNRRQIQASQFASGLLTTLESIVDWAIEENAADIHFNIHTKEQTSKVHFTINGIYIAPKQWELTTSTMLEMLGTAWGLSQGGNGATYDPRTEQQCSIELHRPKGSVMLRWASIGSEYPGPSVTCRLIHLNVEGEIKTLEALSYLPEQIETLKRAQNSEKGCIVFCGVVGSGKTHSLATLASMEPPTRKGMGCEDPVELIIPGMIQKSITRPLDEDDSSNPFGPFLKTAKRSGMHYVLLGEIRDAVTGIALTDLVYTGTSMYTTTHSSSSIGCFDKLSGDTIKVSRDFLSAPGNIKLVVYQALLPQNCPKCALPASELATNGSYKRYGQQYLDLIQELYGINMDGVKIRNAEGCPVCRHASIPALSGYKGRTMVAEMFEPDEESLEMIKRADSIGLHRYFASLRNGIPFDDPRMTGKTAMECAVYKMSQGQIDPREIEPRFHSFETERRRRASTTKYSALKTNVLGGGHREFLGGESMLGASSIQRIGGLND